MALTISPAGILRLLRGLLVAELSASTRPDLSSRDAAQWPDDVSLEGDGLGLDSLERLGCAAAVNQFFNLHETGIEDTLLLERRLDGWARVVAAALAEGTSGMTLTTSGSTGRPKPCRHRIATLLDETAFWAAHTGGCTGVIQLVPPHHIYGLLFTVLLPERLGVPVLDGRMMAPGRLQRAMAEGAAAGRCLLVGYPGGLAQMLRSLPALPPGVEVVSSTAPLPAALHAEAHAQGAVRVTEVYGSTETSGVGFRTAPDAPFTLLPRWRPGGDGGDASVIETATGVHYPLPDLVEWAGERALHLRGRKDMAVQVGGINVFPAAVAEALRQHPLVRDCAVRLDETLAEPRLKALIVPVAAVDPLNAAREVAAWCRARFPATERPVRIDTAAALPLDELGKPADWQHAA